jgi:hypothetical protein
LPALIVVTQLSNLPRDAASLSLQQSRLRRQTLRTSFIVHALSVLARQMHTGTGIDIHRHVLVVLIRLLLPPRPCRLKPNLALVVLSWVCRAAHNEGVLDPVKATALAMQLQFITFHDTRVLVGRPLQLFHVVRRPSIQVVGWRENLLVLGTCGVAKREEVVCDGGGAKGQTNRCRRSKHRNSFPITAPSPCRETTDALSRTATSDR